MLLPAEFGAVNVAVVAVTGVIVPVDEVHVTPAPPVSFATAAVIVIAWPTTSPPAFGLTVTPLADPAAAIVIVALALFVVSATEVAVSVTAAGEGTAPGAVYVIAVPEALLAAESVPHVAAVHPAPMSVHVTPLFAESPVTVAVKLELLLTTTIAVGCESETATPAATPEAIVIVAEADFVPSVTDVAVMVTVAGLGTVAGAVYVVAVPDAEVIAESEPQPFAQESAQVTPLLALSFVTVAVNACVLPTATDAVVGVIVTVTDVDPPPPVPGVELEPPPQPVASPIARAPIANVAIAKVCRQLRSLCARTITLLQF
jgi:hypothetical protein